MSNVWYHLASGSFRRRPRHRTDGKMVSTSTSFQEYASEWLAANARPLSDQMLEPPDNLDEGTLPAARDWQHRLADARLACLRWPAQYGGREATLDDEIA